MHYLPTPLPALPKQAGSLLRLTHTRPLVPSRAVYAGMLIGRVPVAGTSRLSVVGVRKPCYLAQLPIAWISGRWQIFVWGPRGGIISGLLCGAVRCGLAYYVVQCGAVRCGLAYYSRTSPSRECCGGACPDCQKAGKHHK